MTHKLTTKSIFTPFREYRPSLWYYNAGEAPTKSILNFQPHLVHRVKTGFGVDNLAEQLYNQNWSGWINANTLHLLSSHTYLHNKSIDEYGYRGCNCTFATLADQILSNLQDENIQVFAKNVSKPPEVAVDTQFVQMVRLFLKSASKSLLKKHLTLNIFDELRNTVTPSYNSSLEDVIRNGEDRLSFMNVFRQ